MILFFTILDIIGMQTAIEKMLKNGLKNISDETARAYFTHLTGLGEVTVGGEVMTGSALMRNYDEFAKQEFKEAEKAIAKGRKKATKTDGGAVAKPERKKSAYLLFTEKTRPELQAKHKDIPFGELNKMLGALWKDPATKAKWQKVYEENNKNAEQQATVNLQTGVVQTAGLNRVTDEVSVDNWEPKFATHAAHACATTNFKGDKALFPYRKDATGKDGAFKLADLKKILLQYEAEQTTVDADIDTSNGNKSDGDTNESSTVNIGDAGRIWNVDEDDWEYGTITKFNPKTQKHTFKYDETGKTKQIKIGELLEIEHFELGPFDDVEYEEEECEEEDGEEDGEDEDGEEECEEELEEEEE